MGKFKIALVIASMFVCTSMLNGCSNKVSAQTKEKYVAAIVVGNHSCSKGLNFSSKQVRDVIKEVALNYGEVTIINCDGKPSLKDGFSCDIPDQYKNAAKSKLESDAEIKTNNILLRVDSVRAENEEVDTLEALNVAVRSISSAPSDSCRTIIVCDTGLSTTGLLNFSNNLIGADPEIIAEMLAEKHAIPDFSNTTVIWQQLGDCAYPQKELTPSQKYALTEIWKAIIRKGGGIWIESGMSPNESRMYDSLPTVTPINFPDEDPIRFDATKIDLRETIFEEPIFFSEEQVQFKGDSDEYSDSDKAVNCIQPIADYMREEQGFRLLLVGTTAGDTDSEYVRNLSYARANAVKKTLVQMGINDDRISVVGMGNQDPWHIYGVGTSGELAAQNRKVVLMNADSELALKLL